MTIPQALAAYLLAASLLTLTPGLDTALILRTAAVEGPRRAGLAALGIIGGCLDAGARRVALGLGRPPRPPRRLAFTLLKWAGCAYLVWLGLNLILKPRDSFELSTAGPQAGGDFTWMRRGPAHQPAQSQGGRVLHPLLLPQFSAGGGPGRAVHFPAGRDPLRSWAQLAWSACLIAATRPISVAACSSGPPSSAGSTGSQAASSWASA